MSTLFELGAVTAPIGGKLLFWVALVVSLAAAIVLTSALARSILHLRAPLRRRLAMTLLMPWGAMRLLRGGRPLLPVFWASSVLAYVSLRAALVAAGL